ncbi:MAG TPA: glycosyltransferase 87 family protein [Longilinea sp.]|nr:glycosyltransferase 87 family protein [Longilinea sp.]
MTGILPQITRKMVFSILILAAALLVLLVEFIPTHMLPVGGDFRNNLWGPANLLVHHMSPYGIKFLFASVNAVWMPVIIGLFFPIGYIPLQPASNLFSLLNLSVLFGMAFLLTRTAVKPLMRWLAAIFILVIFPATVSQFVMGQVSLLICLGYLLLIVYFDRLKPVLIGALLAFSLTKPQLAFLFLPAYLVLYYREFGFRKLMWVIGATIAWILVFCLPLFLFYPGWIPDFLANLMENSRWQYPTLYALMLNSTAFRANAVPLGGLYLLLGICLAVFLTMRRNRTEALLWSLAMTPLFSPIVWSWDFVLLLPLFVYLMGELKTKRNAWLLYGGYAVCILLFVWLRSGVNSDHLSFWVPPLMITVMAASIALRRKSAVTV